MDNDRGLVINSLIAATLVKISGRWLPLASRKYSLECIRTLIIAKTAGRNVVANKLWTQEPLKMLSPLEVRKPCCYHSISKS